MAKIKFYNLSSQTVSYNLALLASKKILNLILKDNNSLKIFKGSLTFGNFIDKDTKFMKLNSLQDIVDQVLRSMDDRTVEIEPKDKNVVLAFNNSNKAFQDPKIKIELYEDILQVKNINSLFNELSLLFFDNQSTLQKLENKVSSLKNKLNENKKKTKPQKEVKDSLSPPKKTENSKTKETPQQGKTSSNYKEEPKLTNQKHQKDPFDLSRLEPLKTITNLHKECIYGICLFRSEKLASCSADTTIKIYNLSTGEIEQRLRGHKGWVSYISFLSMNGEYLISSSLDKTIKIWEISESFYSCVKTLIGHTDCVFMAIQISKCRIASCSADKSVRIWSSISPYEQSVIIDLHSSNVNSLLELKNKKYLISGCLKGLYFWGNHNYQLVKHLEDVECLNNNSLIEISNNRLIAESKNFCSLIVVDTNNFLVLSEIYVSDIQSFSSFLMIDDSTVLCGCDMLNKAKENRDTYKGSFIQLDTTTYKVVKRKNDVHNGEIKKMILFERNKVISCSKDHSIKVWGY